MAASRATWTGARRARPGIAATLEQIERLDRLVDSILASVRVVPEGPAVGRRRSTSRALVDEVILSLGPILGQPRGRGRAQRPPPRPGRPAAAAPDPRAPRRERRQVRAARDRRSGSTGRSTKGIVQLGVSDEGPGIPDEWRERIFEPYARRDTHTARGSGIGLYAAKRLGESMGARLWCEPARPHGARFVVALPAAVAV